MGMLSPRKSHYIDFIFFTFLFIAFSCHNVLAQNNISSVEIKGLKKTNLGFCADFLECLGETGNIPEDAIQRDVQQLWNLGLFADVNYEYVDSDEGKKLVFNVKEKFYWLPILGADFSNDNFRFTLGMLNYNLDGRGTFLKSAWHFYDRHSFEITLANPYWFSDRWGMQFDLTRLATLEPTQTYENSAYTRENDFNVTKWNVGNLVFFSPKFRQTFFAGGNYLNERYQEILKPNENAEAVDFMAVKALAKIGFQLNNIDYYYHWRSGWMATSIFETVYTFDPSDWFWKWIGDMRFYKRVGGKHNFSSRFFVGTSTNQPMPFPAFVHDNYVNLRGVGNRVGRGIGELTCNFEWQSTVLFKKHLGAIELGVFTDASTLMPIGGGLDDLFQEDLTHLTMGGGLRIHAFKFYHGVLRIDYGVDVLNPSYNGFVIGLSHFF